MEDPHGHGTEDPDPVHAAQQAAAVRRLEAEEDERLAVVDALRSQGLADVAGRLWARAARVALGVGRHRVIGCIAAVGSDWVAVATPAGEVDVPLRACVWLRELADEPPAVSGPDAGSPAAGARTFAARLAELEVAGALLDVGADAAELELTGRIVAAARDHVVFRDVSGVVWHLAALSWVRLRGD